MKENQLPGRAILPGQTPCGHSGKRGRIAWKNNLTISRQQTGGKYIDCRGGGRPGQSSSGEFVTVNMWEEEKLKEGNLFKAISWVERKYKTT